MVRNSRQLAETGWLGSVALRECPDWLTEFYEGLGDVPDGYRVVDESRHGFGFVEPDPGPLPEVTPTNHRRGLQHENELHEMTAVAKPLLKEHFGGAVVLEEVAYGHEWFRTDLVVVEIDAEALLERVRIASEVSLMEAVRYAKTYWYFLQRGPFQKTDYVENGNYATSTAPEIWRFLERNGFIAVNSNGYAAAVPYPSFATLHACELKQGDWETALEQAARASPSTYSDWTSQYRLDTQQYGYADTRWVVLDAGDIESAYRAREAFAEFGVGLLFVDEGGLVQLVDADRRSPELTKDRLIIQEAAFEEVSVRDVTGLPAEAIGASMMGSEAGGDGDEDSPGEQVGLTGWSS